ncbi:MAG: hypothetical protein R3F42_09815 [Pseudomonadota bacterium]
MRRPLHPLWQCITLAGCLAAAAPAGAGIDPGPQDLAAAFAAAGFEQAADGRYVRCREDPPTLSYTPGQAEVVDLNGDGRPEVWITEGSVFCYGNTGNAFVLLTREGGGWRKLLDEVGTPLQLDSAKDGWPDIEVGGPGFEPFPVYRWDGHGYAPRR